jgi:hypothetical protein
VNTVESGSVPSQVQPTANIEDDNDKDTNADKECYHSSVTGETLQSTCRQFKYIIFYICNNTSFL